MPSESPANNNPYNAPKSDLELNKTQGDVPSISEALSRGYNFSIGDILSEAWAKVSGSKGTIWGGLFIAFGMMIAAGIVMLVAFIVIAAVTAALAQASPEVAGVFGVINMIIINIINMTVSYPVFAGLYLIGIRRAGGYPLDFTMALSGLKKLVPLMLTALLMSLILVLPAVLLGVLAGVIATTNAAWIAIPLAIIGAIYLVYLAVSYLLAMPLVLERGLSPRQALGTSRKAISQHWFKVFFLMMVLGLITALSYLPLFIGLIWTIPMNLIAIGILYRTIFGVLPPAN